MESWATGSVINHVWGWTTTEKATDVACHCSFEHWAKCWDHNCMIASYLVDIQKNQHFHENVCFFPTTIINISWKPATICRCKVPMRMTHFGCWSKLNYICILKRPAFMGYFRANILDRIIDQHVWLICCLTLGKCNSVFERICYCTINIIANIN